MHLREAEIYVEITDSDTGLGLADGEWGEIVVTTLSRRGMPIIRYRSGDLGRIIPGTCSCGSPMRRLDRRISRMGNTIDLGRTGSFGLDDLNEALYALPGLWDFRTEYVCGQSPVLRIDAVAGMNGFCTLDELGSALLRIKAVGQAVDDGNLELDLKVSVRRGPALAGLEKRRIRTTAKGNC